MKTPCEIFVWYLLPGLRRELARSMINDHNLTQVQVAGKLGVTAAAVSQYLSKKRGNLTTNKKIKSEIKNSAEQIVRGDDMVIVREMCRICCIVKTSEIMPDLYQTHTGVSIPDCDFQSKLDNEEADEKKGT